MKTRLVALGCICLLVMTACGTSDQQSAPGPDTATADDLGATGDSGGGDVESDAAGGEDVAEDVTSPDTGALPDATDPDAGADTSATDPDSSVGDTSPEDTSVEDTSAADTSAEDTSAEDTTTPVDAGPLDKITEHSTACKTDSDCTIPCATGVCTKGACQYNIGSGCAVPVGSDKVACYPAGMQSKDAACLRCTPAIDNKALTSVTGAVPFEADTEGWKIKDISGNGITWQLSDKRKVEGKTSLYVGNPKTGVYANDKHVKASVTTATLTIPSFEGVKPTLQFWLYLDTEETKGYDFLRLDATEDKKDAKPTQLWHSDSIGGTTHKVWQLQKVDVSKWAGKTVTLTFTFDTLDGFVNAFEGAYIDQITVRTGCCGNNADCNDGNACSTDTCAPSKASKGLPVCGYTVKKACCSSSADCDDGKPCTLDLCSGPGGTCTHSPKPGCCLTGADCDDKDSCTIDHCPKAGASCQHTNTCCKTDNECVSADSCLAGQCAGGACAFTSICCIKNEECDDFNTCTVDACSKGQCVHSPSKAPGCCSVEPVVNEFDSDLEGWKADGKNSVGVQWHTAKYKGTSSEPENGNGVLKFGVPGKDTFTDIAKTSYGYVTSPVIELPPGQQYTIEVKVKFNLSYKTTSNKLYMYYVVDGKQINSYYNYSKQEYYYVSHKTNDWQIWQKDISAFAGRKFQIKLRGYFFAYSSKKQTGQGIMVDYVKVKTSCQAKKCGGNADCTPASTSCQGGQGICSEGVCSYTNGCCKTSSDCKSPTLCSVGTCKYSKCTFSEKAGCCMTSNDCDDNNPCTVDSCPGAGGQCSHTAIPGCCLSSAECDDKKPCTQDTCVANACKHTDVCCKSDAECDDKDNKCTTDKCGTDGFCKFTPTGAKGCCEPNLWTNTFSTSLMNMTLKNSAGTSKGWQLWKSAPLYKSPKGALYYGNISSKNYNFGSNNGSATTPELLLPAGKTTTASMWMYAAVESSTSYDRIYIYLLDAAGKKTELFNKKSSGFKKNSWMDLKFDLKKWAGQKVRLQIVFNTIDSTANSTLGVLVDDLKFTVKCD